MRDLHKWLFSGNSAIAGIYIQDEDCIMSIAESVEFGFLTRGTGLELLEAQVRNSMRSFAFIF